MSALRRLCARADENILVGRRREEDKRLRKILIVFIQIPNGIIGAAEKERRPEMAENRRFRTFFHLPKTRLCRKRSRIETEMADMI